MAQTKTRSSSRSTSRSAGTRSRSSSRGPRGMGMTDGSSKDEELYRRAAEDALQQLDWAIGYLHGIRKTGISRALAKNRSHIRTRLLGQDAQPDPSAQTDES
jgi:hypothetical protein